MCQDKNLLPPLENNLKHTEGEEGNPFSPIAADHQGSRMGKCTVEGDLDTRSAAWSTRKAQNSLVQELL